MLNADVLATHLRRVAHDALSEIVIEHGLTGPDYRDAVARVRDACEDLRAVVDCEGYRFALGTLPMQSVAASRRCVAINTYHTYRMAVARLRRLVEDVVAEAVAVMLF